MPALPHLPRLSRPALLWLVLAGCVSTSQGEIAPLREEVSALREAHQVDRKRLEALEAQVDAQQLELRRLRGEAPEEGTTQPGGSSSLPIVHLQPQPLRGAPVLPTEVQVREPSAELVAELSRASSRASDGERIEGGSAGSKEEADRLFDSAFEKLKTGELVGAAGMFRDFAHRFPHHPAADNALLDEGIAYYGLRRYQEALEVFDGLAKRYPAGDAVPEALWRAGDCELKLGEPARAQSVYRSLVKSFPGSPEATKAAAQLAALESKDAEKQTAKPQNLAKTEGGSE
jgi:TolA-binding protein